MTYDIDYSGQLRTVPRKPFPWARALITTGAVCLAFVVGRASAAELVRIEGWTITVYAYTSDNRSHHELPIVYESREECRIAIVRVKIEQPGHRLRCDYKNELVKR